MRRLVLSCTAALALAGGAWGQTDPYVVFADVPDEAFIVQGGGVVDNWVHEENDLAIAVSDTIRAMDWSLQTNGSEYDLSGGVLQSDVYAPIAGFQGQLLDGASDGVSSNFAVEWSGQGNVWQTDRDWAGGVAIFNTGQSMVGVTCDSSNGTLWIAEDNTGQITNYALDGTRLGVFSAGDGRWGCLAYEESTDTLWMVNNSTSEMRQYRKDGALLTSQFGNGEFGNVWGGEMPKAGDPCNNCPCPEDVNRDGNVDFADILRILSAWGPCEDECDDCEDGFVDRCGGSEECIECQTPDGRCICTFGASIGCGEFRLCDDGECPPGFFCCLNTCCPEPICMSLCEADAPEFERAQPGELTPTGIMPAAFDQRAPELGVLRDLSGPAPAPALEAADTGLPAGTEFDRARAFLEGPVAAYGRDPKWVQPPDCTENGSCRFSNLNSNLSDFFAYDDFVCTMTGDITEVTFWGAGWIGQSCDILQNLAGVEIIFYEWREGGPCGWEFGPILCRNQIPISDLRATFECDSGGALNLRNYRFDARLPQPCFQEEGQQYAIRIAAQLIDPDGCYFCWTTTPEIRGCEAFSRRPDFPEECGGRGFDQSFVLVTEEVDPCDDCPCPEDINRDGVVSFADILRILAAWGPCEEDCDDCEDGFIDRCGGTDACHLCITPTGACECVIESACDDNFACPDGDCPPGFFCCLGTCCGFPICLPVCDVADGAVPVFEPGELTSGGRRVRAIPTFDRDTHQGPQAGQLR